MTDTTDEINPRQPNGGRIVNVQELPRRGLGDLYMFTMDEDMHDRCLRAAHTRELPSVSNYITGLLDAYLPPSRKDTANG